MKIKKFMSIFLLVSAIIAVNGSEFLHNHADYSQIDRNSCPACVLVSSLHNTLAEKTFTGILLSSSFFPYPDILISNYSVPPRGPNSSRAPPFIFHI